MTTTYLIPKDLEVKYAFPEISFFNYTFQILVSDLVSLIGVPMMVTFGLSHESINIIPNIPFFLGFVWLTITLFCGYLTIFPSPTPLTRNHKRFAIWLNRPKGTYLAPVVTQIADLTFKEEMEVTDSCEQVPKSLKFQVKLPLKFSKPKQMKL